MTRSNYRSAAPSSETALGLTGKCQYADVFIHDGLVADHSSISTNPPLLLHLTADVTLLCSFFLLTSSLLASVISDQVFGL